MYTNIKPKGLTLRYIVALGLIAVLVTLSTFSFQQIISEQKYSSNTLRIAGRDRFLLETIKVYHVAFIASYGDPLHEVYRAALEEAATALEENHQSLLDQEESKNLGGEMLPEVRALYYDDPINLNRRIELYIAAARQLISRDGNKLEDIPALSQSFDAETDKLIIPMTQVVDEHVKQSEAAIYRMGQVEETLWFLAMIVLGLEALFIFRPMTKKISLQLEILEQQKVEAERNLASLKATRHALVESQRISSLGRMVSGFSHELSTPLGITVSAVSQIEEATSDISQQISREHPSIDEIKVNITHLSETVSLASKNLARAGRLLDGFKQSSIDRHSEESCEFSLIKLTQDTIYNLSHELKVKAVQVSVQCPDDIYLEGKPSLLEQLMTNLITNSLSHGFSDKNRGKSSGTININWQFNSETENISLQYQDNGSGIDPDIADQIFEPFSTSKRTGGSGLGLYICHCIVTEDLKGTLTYDKTQQAGVSFYVEFPLNA